MVRNVWGIHTRSNDLREEKKMGGGELVKHWCGGDKRAKKLKKS